MVIVFSWISDQLGFSSAQLWSCLFSGRRGCVKLLGFFQFILFVNHGSISFLVVSAGLLGVAFCIGNSCSVNLPRRLYRQGKITNIQLAVKVPVVIRIHKPQSGQEQQEEETSNFKAGREKVAPHFYGFFKLIIRLTPATDSLLSITVTTFVW